jgi:hypothetical protein
LPTAVKLFVDHIYIYTYIYIYIGIHRTHMHNIKGKHYRKLETNGKFTVENVSVDVVKARYSVWCHQEAFFFFVLVVVNLK